jgi:hypothetical protein
MRISICDEQGLVPCSFFARSPDAAQHERSEVVRR